MVKCRCGPNLLFFFFCSTQASHCCGLSRCGAQALDAQAQRPWPTGPAAPRHARSSRTGARTCVPRIGRWTPNHYATREALYFTFQSSFKFTEKLSGKCRVPIYLLILKTVSSVTNVLHYCAVLQLMRQYWYIIIVLTEVHSVLYVLWVFTNV